MKKILIFIIVIISVVFVYSSWRTQKIVPTGVAGEKTSAAPTQSISANTVTTNASISVPTKIIIPAMGVDTVIESVGMDAKGNMDVPRDDDNAAWYNLGFKPGENGSAVIAAHFDKRSGAPAVFYNLASLKNGDRIMITNETGTELTFRVTSSESYAFDKLPMSAIFNTPGKPTLNLITCDGTFNKSQKNYSQRLVVYAELAE